MHTATLSFLLIAVLSIGIQGQHADCLLPMKEGDCRALLPRWYWNQERMECVAFEYGGCDGNANNFETLEECHQKCHCSQSITEGSCRMDVSSFGWNAEKKSCESFVYSGCDGNSNRFFTVGECKAVCEKKTDASHDVIA